MKKQKTNRHIKERGWSKRRIENWEAEFRQKQRASWPQLIPEITFVLFKCNAIHDRSPVGEIADQAFATYPGNFETFFQGRKIPDYSLVLLALNEAKKRQWGYAAGNWFKGWRLTRKGAAFARDVQRRRDQLRERPAAAKDFQRLAA